MLTLEKKKLNSRSSQIVKGVHPDFLIRAKAMCSIFFNRKESSLGFNSTDNFYWDRTKAYSIESLDKLSL